MVSLGVKKVLTLSPTLSDLLSLDLVRDIGGPLAWILLQLYYMGSLGTLCKKGHSGEGFAKGLDHFTAPTNQPTALHVQHVWPSWRNRSAQLGFVTLTLNL